MSFRDADSVGRYCNLDTSRRGIPIATTTLTVAEYLTYWLDHIAEPSMRRTTYATYEGDVRLHIVPGIGRRKLKTLQAVHIRTWLSQLRTLCQCCAQVVVKLVVKWQNSPQRTAFSLVERRGLEPLT
jgi:hypothetical protein